MKTQSIVKSGAAIGSAVALLLVSVLLAPSPALAGGHGHRGGKLVPTGVEPGASGHATVHGEWLNVFPGPVFVGTATGACRDLTPGKTYTIVVGDWYYGGYEVGSAAASESGGFTFTCEFDVGMPSFWIHIVNDAGQVVLYGDLNTNERLRLAQNAKTYTH